MIWICEYSTRSPLTRIEVVRASGALGLGGLSMEEDVMVSRCPEKRIGVLRRYFLVCLEATVISAVSSSLVRFVTSMNSRFAPAM